MECSRSTESSRGENTKSFLSKRLILVIAICYRNESTQLYAKEVHREQWFTKSQEKKLLYGWHQGICKKWKRTGDPDTIRIYSQHFGMEFGIEKYAILIMKSGNEWNNGRNRTTKIRKTNKMLEEKENYKYLGILRANSMKQRRKRKIRKENLRRGKRF